MNTITKIYPTADELKTINSHLYCTEDDCTGVFTSESNLNLHLVKTHKKDWKVNTGNKEYYCPDLNCIYHKEKFFKTLKLLKQHFLKVHGDKSFLCTTCNKGFSTLAYKNRHAEYCGINFKCCDCNISYVSYESLLTHARRKNHKILNKIKYNPGIHLSTNRKGSDSKIIKKDMLILPKTSRSLQLITIPLVIKTTASTPTFEKSSQTETCTKLPKLKTKQTQVNKKKFNFSTQTLDLHRTRSSETAETQTIGDYSSKKPRLTSTPTNNSIKTQTKAIILKSQACNTSFELDESKYISNPIVHQNTLSTQTTATPTELLYSISTATHDSIYTDTSDLNFECIHSSSQTCFNDDMSVFDSSNFFNCNIETQTDFMFNNDLLNYDPSITNLEDFCQKSYDDILYNTIHTQTVFDDIARSVESQTMMSSNKMQPFLNCRDMANMETQTEVDFKKLLEEINA